MTDPIIIATIAKNGAEEVRVSLDSFRGHHLLDLRVFADYGDADERRPTKKGVSIKVARLPELRRALEAAEAEAVARGLLGDGGAR